MGQISAKLRRTETGHSHWCPGCLEMHVIPDSWQFDGNLDRPTFAPSVTLSGKRRVFDANGRWTGEWIRDEAGNPIDYVCHYFLREGQLQFQNDCTHALRNQTVPLPDLPDYFQDLPAA
jgi:hypothetical protein